MDKKAMDVVLDRIQKLPSLPSVVVELLQDLDNEAIDVSTLARKISSDQAIVARVLRVANSPFFGLSGRVESVNEAVAVLGLSHLRGLISAAAIINVFPQAGHFDWAAFWRHSIATASCAKVLARKIGLHPEAGFTAGLLHDIGILVMGVYFPQAFAYVRSAEGSISENLAAEHAALGFDHAELGGELARRWNFPPAIQQAIALHHTPLLAPCTEHTLADVVYVANLFSHALDQGRIREELAAHVAQESWLRLGLKLQELEMLAPEAQELLDSAVMLIGD